MDLIKKKGKRKKRHSVLRSHADLCFVNVLPLAGEEGAMVMAGGPGLCPEAPPVSRGAWGRWLL